LFLKFRSARSNDCPVSGVLAWLMIVPMLLRIDFGTLHQVKAHMSGIGVPLPVN
jgi:ACR3 family arsenite efflux pump ArsB